MQQYLKDSARTASSEYPHLRKLHPGKIASGLKGAIEAGKAVDALKKGGIYNKAHPLLDQIPYAEGDFVIEHIDPDLVHGILGVMSESPELGELLLDVMGSGEEIDLVKLEEEIGDHLWYIAMLLRALGTDFETAAAKNITKLQLRYPHKFNEADAINRRDVA